MRPALSAVRGGQTVAAAGRLAVAAATRTCRDKKKVRTFRVTIGARWLLRAPHRTPRASPPTDARGASCATPRMAQHVAHRGGRMEIGGATSRRVDRAGSARLRWAAPTPRSLCRGSVAHSRRCRACRCRRSAARTTASSGGAVRSAQAASLPAAMPRRRDARAASTMCASPPQAPRGRAVRRRRRRRFVRACLAIARSAAYRLTRMGFGISLYVLQRCSSTALVLRPPPRQIAPLRWPRLCVSSPTSDPEVVALTHVGRVPCWHRLFPRGCVSRCVSSAQYRLLCRRGCPCRSLRCSRRFTLARISDPVLSLRLLSLSPLSPAAPSRALASRLAAGEAAADIAAVAATTRATVAARRSDAPCCTHVCDT